MKRPALFLALALLAGTACLIAFRAIVLGYPVFPAAPVNAWEVTIDCRIRERVGPLSLALTLPFEEGGRMVVEERIVSGSLVFSLLGEGANRVGTWSGVGAGKEAVVSYRAVILGGRPARATPATPALHPYPAGLSKEEKALAEGLAGRFSSLPPERRIKVLADLSAGRWDGGTPDTGYERSWSEFREAKGRLAALMTLFRASGLPARQVSGLLLQEGVTGSLTDAVEVWSGRRWEAVNVERGERYNPQPPFLTLAVGSAGPVRMSGGEVMDTRWSVKRQVLSRWKFQFEKVTRSGRFLDKWSLFRLPTDFQGTFRILLLVPVGALLICLLRNVVGFPTFGIFMPVLMALAFRNMGLGYGLAIFFGVVLIGYGVRKGIDRLHLLLVPRMSVLLTLVISCFTALALLGHRLGLREFMAVGLLPFVILAMTIERFFIVIEESGVKEALITAMGSMAVALITYEIVSWEPLQLTFFVYPELMAAVGAFQILLGRYTGYRLSEFIRFRPFRKDYDF